MVDALASFDPGIGGAFKLRGFGGGVMYHMERVPPAMITFPNNILQVDPFTIPIGQTLSGVQFIPNHTKGVRVKATVAFSGAKEEAFNGNASFEIAFFAQGGVEEIRFDGHARFFEPMQKNENANLPAAPPTENGNAIASAKKVKPQSTAKICRFCVYFL